MFLKSNFKLLIDVPLESVNVSGVSAIILSELGQQILQV